MSDLHLIRISEKQAGYMELARATKTGDCRKIEVRGGISKELGCCNLFQPESRETQRFRCGDCEYQMSTKGIARHFQGVA